MTFQRTTPPFENWVTHLHRGHVVWCPKNNCFAQIEMSWQKNRENLLKSNHGHIAIRFIWGEIGKQGEWGLGETQVWGMYKSGRGNDGVPLIEPVVDTDTGENHWTNTVATIYTEEVENLSKRIDDMERIYLKERVQLLLNENKVQFHNLMRDSYEVLRSCYSVTLREGAQTNWESLQGRINKVLKDHRTLNPFANKDKDTLPFQ